MSGSVTNCPTVNQGADPISSSLAPGTYTIDGGSCSGPKLSGSGGPALTLADQGVPDGFTVTPASSYTVTYNGNGNTGGTVPVDPNSPYAPGATVTVLANTGNLVDAGYSFSGWNTAPDGSGTSYSASGLASFAMPDANVSLYAQWTSVGQAPAITSANLATFTVGSTGTFTVRRAAPRRPR